MFYLFILVLVLISLIVIKKYSILYKKLNNYEQIIEKQGVLNHEYSNQLMVVLGYLDCKNLEKAKEYLNIIINDNRTGCNYEIRQLSKFPTGGLKKILYFKLSKIENKNIKYYLYINEEFISSIEKVNILLYSNITKILGVLIDNAIDSSEKIDNSYIELNFNKENNYIIISISNPINEHISLKDINNNRFTTKGQGHGFGLKLVKEIIKHNKNIELSTDLKKDNITQTLLIEV